MPDSLPMLALKRRLVATLIAEHERNPFGRDADEHERLRELKHTAGLLAFEESRMRSLAAVHPLTLARIGSAGNPSQVGTGGLERGGRPA